MSKAPPGGAGRNNLTWCHMWSQQELGPNKMWRGVSCSSAVSASREKTQTQGEDANSRQKKALNPPGNQTWNFLAVR